MSDLVKIDPSLIALVGNSFGSDGLPMPFMQEIFLLECKIAGTSFLKLKEIEPNLNPEDLLIMNRETENKYDPLAVMILTQQGEKLGYIPKEKNEVIARLMDAGKLIIGKIVSKSWQGNWLKLMIQIFMRDI